MRTRRSYHYGRLHIRDYDLDRRGHNWTGASCRRHRFNPDDYIIYGISRVSRGLAYAVVPRRVLRGTVGAYHNQYRTINPIPAILCIQRHHLHSIVHHSHIHRVEFCDGRRRFYGARSNWCRGLCKERQVQLMQV